MSIKILPIPFDGEYIVQGDTISKTSFKFIDEDIDLTASNIKMVIKDGNTKIINVSNGNGITVIDADSFEIDEVPFEENNLPSGSFTGDLEITDENDKRLTYMRVKYTILKQLD